jgi:hypothetical protein
MVVLWYGSATSTVPRTGVALLEEMKIKKYFN